MGTQTPTSAFAEFNEYGYKVFVLDQDGDFIFDLTVECGNCAYESTTQVSLSSPHCVPLDKIEEYAKRTLLEVKEEHGILPLDVLTVEYVAPNLEGYD